MATITPMVLLNNPRGMDTISRSTAEQALRDFTNSQAFLENTKQHVDSLCTGPGPREYNEYGKLQRSSVEAVTDWCIHLYLKEESGSAAENLAGDSALPPEIPNAFDGVPIMVFYLK